MTENTDTETTTISTTTILPVRRDELRQRGCHEETDDSATHETHNLQMRDTESDSLTSRLNSKINGIDDTNRAPPPPPSFLADPVILCILVTETAERFAYFGFRAILVLYFTNELQFSESQAIAIYAYNSALAYASPLIGATLADGYLGRYRTILSFGSLYVLGLAVLTFFAFRETPVSSSLTDASSALGWKRFGSFSGLFLVCLGTGGIKPCVSAFGADQVYLKPMATASQSSILDKEETAEQVRAFFNYFYFCINVGAVTSIAIVPILREVKGFGLAFFVPCLFMIGALSLFFSMRKEYLHQATSTSENSMWSTFQLTWSLLYQQVFDNAWVARNFSSFRPERSRQLVVEETNQALVINDFGKQQMDDALRVLNILPIFALFPVFWGLYDQQGSVWTIQSSKMKLPPWLQPEQLNIVNPLEIIVFIPFFDKIAYPFLERKGVNIAPLRRMAFGMVLTALSFFVSGFVESAIQHCEQNDFAKVSVFWQLPQITLLAVGEIFLSVTGLEFAYQMSPDRLKAFLTALFLATTGIGDCFSGLLYSTVFADMNRAVVMHICAFLMLVDLCLFLRVAKWYEKRDTQQSPPHSSVVEGLELELLSLPEVA